MSVKSTKLLILSAELRALEVREAKERRSFNRYFLRIFRYLKSLQHEFVKDDVRIRAESLAYLTLFSLLPIISGCFFVFTLFAKVGLVQESVGRLVEKFLKQIPDAHRDFVLDYVIKFKDAYLSTLSEKSGQLGIFSFSVLIWIGYKMYVNIDATLNHIWQSERQRSTVVKMRNLIVISVVGPTILIGGLSLPLILESVPLTKRMLELVPVTALLMNDLLPMALLFLGLTSLYKFLPYQKVKWKAAVYGGLSTMILLQLSNTFMQFYFQFGTQSAYGKAAVLPLIGFWIYIVWLVIIMGAEFSFLVQNDGRISRSISRGVSLNVGYDLLRVLLCLEETKRNRMQPIEIGLLSGKLGLGIFELKEILDIAVGEKWIVECVTEDAELDSYALNIDLNDVDVFELLSSFYDCSELEPSRIKAYWKRGLDTWFSFHKKQFLPQFLNKSDKL